MILSFLFFILLGCFASWLVTHLLLSARFAENETCEKQHHHTHSGSMPRIGGIGIVTAFGIVYLLCFIFLDDRDNTSLINYAVAAGAVGAFILGFIDDFRPLKARTKFAGQIVLALLAYYSGLSIERVGIPFTEIQIHLGIFGVLITVFWFVAIMNIMNLIDGLDGLAGGIGLMLMLLLVYLSYQKGSQISGILALGMTGALVGFLFHNFPPARVYMGDSGAYLIGYVIAALALMNAEKGTVLAALMAPVLALALPIADVGFAMLRRSFQGLPIFRPDREHIHHRLLRSGLSSRNAVLVLYCFSLLAFFGGILVFTWQGRYLPLFFGFAVALLLLVLRGQKMSLAGLRAAVESSLQGRKETRNAISLQHWFLLEIERVDSGQNAWEDYHFFLKKLGFCRAEMEVSGESRSFFIEGTPYNQDELLWVGRQNLVNGASLVVYGEKDNFSQAQFELLCDIVTESWNKASARWKELHGSILTFDTEASRPQNYNAQKARNLYRPPN
ncbi:MAG: putative undecaprenyl-phosphate N-acetylglucosaminyl 1-phosphate transferase [Opitutia bacterium UBA7350]|nr:MAG: putative undecaprenyl-phosphate N-acetylglucosaminyl 1-phosphate transferase [Opitutae bacterium UBA7350]